MPATRSSRRSTAASSLEYTPSAQVFARNVVPTFYEFSDYARLVDSAAKISTRTLVVVLLGGDAPGGRAVESQSCGRVVALPRVGGLHHRYSRAA